MKNSNGLDTLFRVNNQAGALLRQSMHMLKAFDLEPWHGLILEMLDSAPYPLPITEVVTALRRPKSTITKATDHLRDADLIDKRQNKKDGRSLVVQITPQGRAALEDFRQAYRQTEALLYHGIPEAELATFLKVLARMEKNLE